jgi:hypothetical protein
METDAACILELQALEGVAIQRPDCSEECVQRSGLLAEMLHRRIVKDGAYGVGHGGNNAAAGLRVVVCLLLVEMRQGCARRRCPSASSSQSSFGHTGISCAGPRFWSCLISCWRV